MYVKYLSVKQNFIKNCLFVFKIKFIFVLKRYLKNQEYGQNLRLHSQEG